MAPKRFPKVYIVRHGQTEWYAQQVAPRRYASESSYVLLVTVWPLGA